MVDLKIFRLEWCVFDKKGGMQIRIVVPAFVKIFNFWIEFTFYNGQTKFYAGVDKAKKLKYIYQF